MTEPSGAPGAAYAAVGLTVGWSQGSRVGGTTIEDVALVNLSFRDVENELREATFGFAHRDARHAASVFLASAVAGPPWGRPEGLDTLAHLRQQMRQAVLDPGSFTPRGRGSDGTAYGESMDRWQDRALEIALLGRVDG